MANRNSTFLLKRSNIPNKIPNIGDLLLGELALNTADSKLYTSYTGGLSGATEIRQIGWDRLSTISGGTVNGNVDIIGSISATTYLNLPQFSGDYLPLSGGTVYGDTYFTSGLTASTLTVTGLTQTYGITSTAGVTFKQVTINSTYSATTEDYMIDVSGGTFTVYLPSAVGIQGRLIVVKNNGGGAVTVQPIFGQTIDDKPFVILGETNSLQLASNGVEWVALGYNISTVNSSTGVFEFTGITKVSSTQFYVSPVKGWIVDDTTNALSPQLYYIDYSGGTHTDNYVNTDYETFIYLNSGNTISQQPIPLTEQQRRQNIFLGKVGHPDKTSINLVFSQPDFVLSPLAQLRDLFTPINLINGGVVPSTNGSNLKFNTNAGYLYGLGINFVSDILNPNALYVPGTNPCTFQYRTQTGGTVTNVTDIDPLNYDVGGVVTPITGTKASNQRIYLLQNGTIRVMYGQEVYNTLSLAIESLQTESFTPFPNFVNNAVLIGILTVLSTATDLTDTSKARFFFASKFGETVGTAGGTSTTNLQQAYNNSSNPEIITNSIQGGVQFRGGTGIDSDSNIIIENNSGVVTGKWLSNGYLSATTLYSSGNVNVGGNIIVTGGTGINWFSSNTSTDLVRITQTGSGNALFIEDSTNPDSSPFVVDSSGNVGIGITGTTVPLYVRSNAIPSTNENILRLDVSDAIGSYLDIRNGSTTDGQFTAEIVGNQSSTSNLTSIIQGGYINSSQDTGTNPVTIFRSALSSLTPVSTRPLFDFRNWSASTMLIAASGNVGIGTTTPTSKLTVVTSETPAYPTNSGTTQTGYFTRFRNIGSNLVLDMGGNTSNGNWLQSTNQTDLSLTYPLLLNPNGGNVGIGVLVPTQKLHVSGNALITGTTYTSNLIVTGGTGINWISGSTSTDMLRITQTGTGNALVVEDSTNPDLTSFVINGTGIVGVGVSPSSWETETNPLYSGTTNTGNRFYISGNIISGGDKLGIGFYNTTNPFNITNVISGTSVTSNFGSLLESYQNGQFVIGIRDNDANDGFNILSHNGQYTGTSEYSKLVATFKGSGKIGLGGVKEPTETLEVSGNTLIKGSLSATTITGDGNNITNFPNKLLAITELTASTLVTHTVGTTNFTAINLNSDGTNRFAKITFVAPPSGSVSIEMEFDMTIVNSAAVQMIGLNTTTGATSTPSDGWYRVNADNDSTSGQFYAKFIKTGLTPGTSYTYYFMGVCDFTSNTIRTSRVQTGAYSAGSDLPSPLRIYVYDLGGITITRNPSS